MKSKHKIFLVSFLLAAVVAAAIFYSFSGRIFATATCTALTSPVIFTSDVTISADDATCDGFDITLGDGTNPVTMTIDGSHSFSDLTIRNNAVLTHTLLGDGVTGNLVLDVSSGTVDIEAGGSIDLDGKGSYVSSGYQRGGTYGGRGANSLTGAYGSIVDPTHPGGRVNHSSGAGGGYVKILADALNVAGDITATGTYWNYGCWDGGSGGGINVVADTISGTGNITAIGGPGFSCGSAGGGGRISVRYVTSLAGTVNLSAKGGCNGSCSADNNDGGAGTVYKSQVTSIATPTAVVGTRNLVIDNDDVTSNSVAYTDIISTHATDYDSVTIDNTGQVLILNGATINTEDFLMDNGSSLRANSGGTFIMGDGTDTLLIQGNSSATFDNGSTFDVPDTEISYGTMSVDTTYAASSATVDKFSMTTGSGESVFTLGPNGSMTLPQLDATNFVAGTASFNGDITLTSSDVLVDSGNTLRFGNDNTVNSLTVNAGGTLISNGTLTSLTDIDLYGDASHDVLDPGATGGIGLVANSGNLNIHAGASIDASIKGRYTNNGTINQGGVYGGKGHDTLASTYGSIKTPTHPGSSVSTTAYGGGYITLEALNLDVDGDVIADGGQFNYGCLDGASGGGVLIVADTITGTGSIRANGGDSFGGSCISGPGSAGGGGRIAVKYVNSLAGTVSVEARGGCNTSLGCSSATANNGNGGAGTYYSAQIDGIVTQNPVAGTEDLMISNGVVRASTTSFTDIITGQDSGYDTLVLDDYSRLNILNGGLITTEEFTFDTGAYMDIDSGGIFVMSDPGDTLTLDGNTYVNVDNGGTLTVPNTLISHGTMVFDSDYDSSSATLGNFTMTDGAGTSTFVLGENGSMTLPVFDASNIQEGTFTQSGTLVVTDHNPVVVDDGVTYVTNVDTTYDDIDVSAGGTLTANVRIASNADFDIYGTVNHDLLDAGTTGGLDIEADSGSVTVYAGGLIEADAKGRYQDSPTINFGASYGGRGNNTNHDTYGDLKNPTLPGSSTANIGFGGGYISVLADTLTIDGDITADGSYRDYGCRDGGSGGGILLVANTIAGTGNVGAIGGAGSGGACFTGPGGSGGGGRIAAKYVSSLAETISFSAAGGCNPSTGCTSTATLNGHGGAGTVYTTQIDSLVGLDSIASTETLTVTNGGTYADSTAYTTLDETTFSDGLINTLDITNGAVVHLDRSATATTSTFVGANSTLSHSLLAEDFQLTTGTLEVEDGGEIDVSQKGAYTKTSEAGNHGGSYGGEGLPPTGTPGNGAPDTYGDEFNPLFPGQQGNGSSGDYYGGGYVNMTINGDLNLNTTGRILANGGGATSTGSGGGSGGGIKITVSGDVLGDATAPVSDDVAQIQALGGDGSTVSDNGGAGGGGRIYVTYGGTNNLNPLHGVVTGGTDGGGGNAGTGTVHFDELANLTPPAGFTSSVDTGFQDGVDAVLSDSGALPRLKITANFASADGGIDLSGITLDGNANATVVNGLSTLSGNGDIAPTHSIYVPNTLDASVFICPDATILTQVLDNCANVVAVDLLNTTYLGNIGSTVSVGGDNVDVSLVDENDQLVALGTPNSYWLIEGLTGSGGGEQGSQGGFGGYDQYATQELTGGDVILYDIPDNFSFAPVGTGSANVTFSNPGGTDAGDSLVVLDQSNTDAGFVLQIQANDFVGPGGATIPATNLYAVTTPSSSAGTAISGVRHTGQVQGAAIAPLDVDTASAETLLGTASTFTTYGSQINNPVTVLSTTDPTGVTGFEVNMSYYLTIPEFQAPGVYSGRIVYTMIPN